MIVASVFCRSCGYDLRGLATTGSCPECGLEVRETLTHLVDPAASRLPKLNDPRGVGDGLLGLAVTATLVTLVLVLPSALRLLGAVGLAQSTARHIDPGTAALIASGISFVGLWWARLVARGPAESPRTVAHRDLRRMFVGLGSWTLVLAACGLGMLEKPGPLVEAALVVLPMPFAIVGLLGLRGVLDLVGLRSRAYRTARSGRQSVDGLVAALAAGAIGLGLAVIGLRLDRGWLETVGHAVALASILLFLIGLLYLVVNCWWIRSSLRSPPPRLSDLVAPSASTR
ncbi:MAG: hypothetical protein KDA22_14770 [Phycisphaerales bacterium]|nr:hypothetical protein [Phycisphaerales bacterium]